MNYLGFDIGGTKSAVLFGTDSGEILWRRQIQTTTPEETLAKLFQLAKESGYQACAAGVSCGGPLDEQKGLILSPPNLPGWDEIPITKMIEDAFQIPAYLCNDANACALAEWRFGAGKGTRNMIFCTFGTGMGAGLVLDGRLYTGTNGNAGEIGHVRMEKDGPIGFGKKGSFEGFVSGGGLAQLGKIIAKDCLMNKKKCAFCKEESELDSITARSIAEAAFAGDEAAKEVYRICGMYLGRGLSILIDLFNPECIVLGSVFARSGELMIPAMQKELEAECLAEALRVVRIVPAGLGEQIGDYAAIVIAMEGEKDK